MATAKPRMTSPGTRAGPPRRGWLFRLGVFAALALFVGLALSWSHFSSRARLAAAYGARVGCSCHYIGGRDLKDCRKDFESGMGPVWLSEDADERTITARYPLLATQSASFREGEGCVLEKWPG